MTSSVTFKINVLILVTPCIIHMYYITDQQTGISLNKTTAAIFRLFNELD
jgi:hypothetical protein